MIERNDPCWCGSQKKWKKCHYPLKSNCSADIKEQYLKQYGIIIKEEHEIDLIRSSCQLAAKILNELCKFAKEGITTEELDNIAVKLHKEAGAIAAPLGYGHPPFPKSICTSLNDVICHGIPDNTRLKNGDILNIDVTTILNGYFGDTSRMVVIGDINPEKKLVVDTSLECLNRAIKILKPGVLIKEIGDVIENYATLHSCSVVHQFVGHGVGRHFHEPPQIPHCYNTIEIPLIEGMTFTIEPMINAGVREAEIDPKNHWTAYTKDRRPSAQWEHTILITKDGCEVLTQL